MAILNNSNAISSNGYDINNSLRFRGSASPYLSRTPSSSSNRQTWTWSGWVKRGSLGSFQVLFGAGQNNPVTSDDLVSLYINSSDQIAHYVVQNGVADCNNISTMVLRDPSAWYHIVFIYDSTNATASNRQRIYVNGTQVTSFSSTTYVGQNYQAGVNLASRPHALGVYAYNFSSRYFDGYMSEVNFIDGQALTPSSFGETDTTTGAWVAKKYTGTYGTNGFYLPFTTSTTTAYAGQFNGSNQSISLASNSAFAYGTGDFTAECWINLSATPSTDAGIIEQRPISTNGAYFSMFINSSRQPFIFVNSSTRITGSAISTGSWYHLAYSRVSGTGTFYINGISQGSWSDTTSYLSEPVYIGQHTGGGAYFNGYISNVRLVKGTGVYTAGFTPPTTGLTAITNTQLLTLQNSTLIDNSTNSFTLTNNNTVTFPSGNVIFNANIGSDKSGGVNHWLPNNINYSLYGSTYDSMIDSPTLSSASGTQPVGNYAIWNPLDKDSATVITDGNLKANGQNSGGAASIALTSGKWYWETTLVDSYNGPQAYWGTHGVTAGKSSSYNSIGSGAAGVFPSAVGGLGGTYANGSLVTGQTTWANGDVIGFAFDATNLTLDIYRNNTKIGTTLTVPSGAIFPTYNLSGTSGDTSTITSNFGQQPFTYTPPTGYKSICTTNLPDSTVKKGNSYMNVVTYTGDGASTKTISGLTFQPDFIWIKRRDGASDHNLQDAVRGFSSSTKLATSSTYAENTLDGLYTDPKWGYVSAVSSTGFTVTKSTNGDHVNYNASPYVAWTWDANGSGSTNTAGSITSTVSVNTTAGFSVITYAGSNSSPNTIGHGLGVAPKLWIIKNRSSSSGNWVVNYIYTDNGVKYAFLNTTAGGSAQGSPWSTLPTSSVITLGGNDVNTCQSGSNYVCYAWAEIAGFSKIGYYTGNGSSDGPFNYLGFRPKFVMVKRVDASGYNWTILDTARDAYNYAHYELYPNTSGAEVNASSSYTEDILSNGFKIRQTDGTWNASGGTYLYMAFAENPFKNANAR